MLEKNKTELLAWPVKTGTKTIKWFGGRAVKMVLEAPRRGLAAGEILYQTAFPRQAHITTRLQNNQYEKELESLDRDSNAKPNDPTLPEKINRLRLHTARKWAQGMLVGEVPISLDGARQVISILGLGPEPEDAELMERLMNRVPLDDPALGLSPVPDTPATLFEEI